MTNEDYVKALKLGQKEYDTCVSKGLYPYLANLDDMTEHVEIEARVKLGLVDIPIELIVGTYQKNRSNAFARNFMPLLDKGSEFANKWVKLIESLEEEGLREPIVAYEFLGSFYVQEGNKRVCCSKYMGAVSVEGTVTRIIPKRTDAPEIRRYYEFLDFYAKAPINYLNFSKEGSYVQLMKIVNGDHDTPWTEEMLEDFRSVYSNFKKEFLAKGGAKLSITPGDALLVYLTIFGYEKAKNNLAADFRADINKLWEEFIVYSRTRSISISLSPKETVWKPSNLFNFLPGKTYRAAWFYPKNKEDSAWVYSHELGREHIIDLFGDQVPTAAFYDIATEDAEETMTNAIKDGYNVIFAASPQYISACAKVAVNYPEVKMLNCSLNTSYKHVRSYYLRTYEAKFIIGAMAGSLTKNNKIGYIADYPIYGSAASINAFAMGARMVNPEAEIYLEWSSAKDSNPMKAFDEKEVAVISSHDMHPPTKISREYGLYRMNGDRPANIAVPIWHWGKLYEEILQGILTGNWKDEADDVGMRSLMYWWGLSADALEVIHSAQIPNGTTRLASLLENAIASSSFHPFSGELIFQDGSILDCGIALPPEEIITMNKLVAPVHGFIPKIDDVKDEYRMLISDQGLFRPETATQL